MAGAAQIFFDGVDHVLLSGAELFASVAEPPSDGQDAPPRCIFFGVRQGSCWLRRHECGTSKDYEYRIGRIVRNKRRPFIHVLDEYFTMFEFGCPDDRED